MANGEETGLLTPKEPGMSAPSPPEAPHSLQMLNLNPNLTDAVQHLKEEGFLTESVVIKTEINLTSYPALQTHYQSKDRATSRVIGMR